jgi:leader peptidase (prepilin peptidase)/N-methyltransferase
MHCQNPIPFYFNIPILAYIFLRGKTSCCQKSLAIQYPIVEAFTAFGGVYIAYVNGLNIESVLSFFFFLSILIIFFTDLNEYIIPNIISYSVSILGVVVSYFSLSIFNISFIESLIGGLVCGGVLLLTSKIYLLIRKKEGMGMGDVKMITMIGFWMGLENTFIILIVSSLLGSIIGIALIQFKKMDSITVYSFWNFLINWHPSGLGFIQWF